MQQVNELTESIPTSSLAWRGSEIPSLYGIRGVAAMVVVLSHIGITAFNGSYAVICFFVLSGFLITHLLLKEYDRTGDVSLRRFYARRALRIFPAFYGYVLVYVIGRILLHLPIHWPTVLACLTYTTNYYTGLHEAAPPTMVHVWSLAVEEQFYLLWPFIFWKFADNRASLIKGLMAVILAVWAYRWLTVLWDFPGTYVFAAFETRADALAIGCLLAIANRESLIPRWLIDWKWIAPVALLAITASSFALLNGPRYAWSLVAVGFALILIQSVAHSQMVWYRWLNTRPLYALGVISYSLYLYHPFANRLPATLRIVPVEIAFAIALAVGSYVIVERPFLLWKARISNTSRSVRTYSLQ